MDDSEKKIRQEDCNEDTFGSGILTLTNKRIAFDKTRGRIADFSKKIGETVLDVPLSNVIEVWKEGRFMKKVCIKVKTKEGEKSVNLARSARHRIKIARKGMSTVFFLTFISRNPLPKGFSTGSFEKEVER